VSSAGDAFVHNFYKTRTSVRGVLALAAQLLLPIEGICKKLEYVSIFPSVAHAGSICLDALREPTRCASPRARLRADPFTSEHGKRQQCNWYRSLTSAHLPTQRDRGHQ